MNTGYVACSRNLPCDSNRSRQATLQKALRASSFLLRNHLPRLLHCYQGQWMYGTDFLTCNLIGSFHKSNEFRHQETLLSLTYVGYCNRTTAREQCHPTPSFILSAAKDQ